MESYHCSQLFGYKSRSQKLIEEDKITALKFDSSGKMLALGDKAGRLIVFHAMDSATSEQQYDYHFEFQSHQREFDTLKSSSIKEQISHINWLRPQEKYMKLLTSNSNTIKLWKIYEKVQKNIVKSASEYLPFPQMEEEQPTMSINLKKIFPNKACCALNNVSLSKNEEFLFATDESNVFLWSLQRQNHPYLIKQIENSYNKKVEKSEKITCSQMHPDSQLMFIYGTSKGFLGFNDTRTSITNSCTLVFKSDKTQSNFLSQIINKYCSVMFIAGTRKIVTRDLITIKIWDMCNNKKPMAQFPIDEDIKSHLCDLFEADSLDDSFHLSDINGSILTGNYGDSFHLIEGEDIRNMQYQLDYSKATWIRQVGSNLPRRNPFNCTEKILNHDFNRVTGQIALSTHNCFFIYSKD